MSEEITTEQVAQAIKVERGNPSPEQLAAAIAVLTALAAEAAAASTGTKKTVSSWQRNHAQLRSPIVPGRRQWQAAYLAGLS